MQEYKGKLDSALATDASIKQKFDASAQGFMMLDKTRAELSQMIPKSPAAAQIDQDPTVLTIKDQMNQLENIRQGKEKVMNDGVAMHEQLNAVEEMMKVNSGAISKQEVFQNYTAKY